MQTFKVAKVKSTLSQYDIETLLDKPLTCDMFLDDASDEEKRNQTLKENDVLFIGVEYESGRGFELVLKDDFYEVRVTSPSIIEDWKHATTFMSNLSVREEVDIIDKNGNTYDNNSIFEFDYKKNIKEGLDIMYEKLCLESNTASMTVMGLHYALAFNDSMIKEIFGAKDIILAYSDFVRESQWIDAYPIRQQLLSHEVRKETHSVYTLIPNVPLILPKKPTIDIMYLMQGVEEKDVDRYVILVFDANNQVIGEIEHSKFESILPYDCYEPIDAINIVTRKLTIEELRELIKK